MRKKEHTLYKGNGYHIPTKQNVDKPMKIQPTIEQLAQIDSVEMLIDIRDILEEISITLHNKLGKNWGRNA